MFPENEILIRFYIYFALHKIEVFLKGAMDVEVSKFGKKCFYFLKYLKFDHFIDKINSFLSADVIRQNNLFYLFYDETAYFV